MQGSIASPPAWSPMPRSCTTCRQRKVKCDKFHPCGACHRSGVQCVYPSHRRAKRVQKGAGQARNSELLQRISRLETLVHKVEADTSVATGRQSFVDDVDDVIPSGEVVQSGHEAPTVQQQTRPVGDHYLSGDFWTALSDEVDGLKQLLEHPSDDEDENAEESMSNSTESQHMSPSNFIFREPDSAAGIDLQQPSDAHRAILVRKFFTNVSPVCRILHEPTTIVALLGDIVKSETGSSVANVTYYIKPKAKTALMFSMCFAAITSMTAADCSATFGEDRENLLSRYKVLVESALNYADFLNSMDIVPLQAFAIYLMAIRAHSKDRTSWTLVSLAVRIAHSLNLHRDGDGLTFSAFEAEMRRRLWWQILVIDLRASEDRGSETVIQNDSFNIRMPLNIQDEDFGPDSPHPLPQRPGFSDMSFCLISMDVSNTVRRLNFISPVVDDTNSSKSLLTIEQKEDLVRQCTDRIENQYLLGCDPSNPSMMVFSNLGQLLVVKLWLTLQYPLQSRQPSPRSRYPKDLSLRSAVTFLELTEIVGELTATSGQHFWYRQYVPWHALAVALAELCSQTEGELVERAWTVIDREFDVWSERVADSKEGMLWRPLKKLLSKAQAARQTAKGHDGKSATTQTQLATDPTSVPLNAGYYDADKFRLHPFATQSMPGSAPVTAFPTEPAISEMPDLNIDLGGYSYDLPIQSKIESVSAFTTTGIGLEWLQFPDMEVFPGTEVSGGEPNWDHWNEFINGAAMAGAQVDTNTEHFTM